MNSILAIPFEIPSSSSSSSTWQTRTRAFPSPSSLTRPPPPYKNHDDDQMGGTSSYLEALRKCRSTCDTNTQPEPQEQDQVINIPSSSAKSSSMERIHWNSTTVIHSIGNPHSLLAQYSFDPSQHGGRIQHVVVALFPSTTTPPSRRTMRRTTNPPPNSNPNPILGPFQSENHRPNPWSDEVISLPLDPPPPDEPESSSSSQNIAPSHYSPYLCVLLTNQQLYIYPQTSPSHRAGADGGGITPWIVNLDTSTEQILPTLGSSYDHPRKRVVKMWPLPVIEERSGQSGGGLLIEYAIESNHLKTTTVWNSLADLKAGLKPIERPGGDDRSAIVAILNCPASSMTAKPNSSKGKERGQDRSEDQVVIVAFDYEQATLTLSRATTCSSTSTEPKSKASSNPVAASDPTATVAGEVSSLSPTSNERTTAGQKRKRTVSGHLSDSTVANLAPPPPPQVSTTLSGPRTSLSGPLHTSRRVSINNSSSLAHHHLHHHHHHHPTADEDQLMLLEALGTNAGSGSTTTTGAGPIHPSSISMRRNPTSSSSSTSTSAGIGFTSLNPNGGGGGGPDPPILHHHHPAPPPPNSTIGTGAANRRSSMTRNELSITMDRMALGQRGGQPHPQPAPPPPPPPPHLDSNHSMIAADRSLLGAGATHSFVYDQLGGGMMREEECAFGLIEIEDKSDWVIEVELEMRIEGMEKPPISAEKNEGRIQAFIFDARCGQSTLAVLFPRVNTLYLFGINSDGTTIEVLGQRKASYACLVSRTRKGISDLLVVDPDSGWTCLTTATTFSTVEGLRQIAPPDSIERLDSDPLSDSIFVRLSDGSSSMITLPRSIVALTSCSVGDRLTNLCLQALSRVLELRSLTTLLDQIERIAAATTKQSRSSLIVWQAFMDSILPRKEEGEESQQPPSKDKAAKLLINRAAQLNRGQDPVLSMLQRSFTPAGTPSRPERASRTLSKSEYRILEAILMTLHLVGQHLKLSLVTRREYDRLGQFNLELAEVLGNQEWIDAYRIWIGEPWSDSEVEGLTARSSPVESKLPASPPSIMDYIRYLLREPNTPDASPFAPSSFELHQVATRFNFEPCYFFGRTDQSPLETLSRVRDLFETLVATSPLAPQTSSSSTSANRSMAVIEKMQRYRMTLSDLDRLNFGVGLVLRECVRVGQNEAPVGLTEQMYRLLGRPDLAKQGKGDEIEIDRSKGFERWAIKGRPLPIDTIVQKTKAGRMEAIAATSIPPLSSSTREVVATAATVLPKAVRFNEDRRVEEVARMLQFTSPVTIGGDRHDRTLDQLTPQTQQATLMFLSNRTLALPIGYGMFNYRTKSGQPTDTVSIPSINTSARILPMPSPVALIEKEPRDNHHGPGSNPLDRFGWPEFHTGVATALQFQAAPSKNGGVDQDPLRGDSSGFDASHISFNKPNELDSKHAGFLFGLGLSGHLSQIAFNQAFEYLKMKHDPTSIGLLLGLSVTYIATGDPKVTSLLSVHLAALHPPHSSTLNISGMTQSAALVGLGLLHLGSTKRTLADVMIRELCGIRVTMVEDAAACREAYALSAGFSFGLIMLGSGTEAKNTPGEVELLRTLTALMTTDSSHPLPTPAGTPQQSNNVTDVQITSPAATIALAMMYLRTERHDVASLIEIPDTPKRLDYVRADLLLLRTLARSIILWDRIQLSRTWVDSHIPLFISKAAEAAKLKGKPLETDLEIARWNIIAGACFAIGLKFAGAAAAEAHATLIYYLDRLTRAAFTKATTAQAKIRRHAIRACLSVVAIALSMVMAGTGEINVLRRLRVAHGHFGEGVTFGTHLASHMALGLLFVGSGNFTLGTSNASIAALLIAFFPSFPPVPSENRSHLQAFRHLWTLAVEPRCLIARDVDTGEPTFLPVRLRLVDPIEGGNGSTTSANEVRAKQLVAPTLIPELKLIQTIQIDTPRYWSFALNLSPTSPSNQLGQFLADRTTLWVKRRTGHLSYAQDPRGIRSIFTRSKSETGSAVLDFGRTARLLSPSSQGLQDFISSFSDDLEARAMVESICNPMSDRDSPPTEWEAFAATVLLECLTRDKKDVVSIYHALFHSKHLERSSDRLNAQEQTDLIVELYDPRTFGHWFGEANKLSKKSNPSTSKSSTTESLLHPSFIDHLRLDPPGTSQTQTETIDQFFESLLWPTDPTCSADLAMYLIHNNAPSLAVIQQLVRLLRTSSESQEAELRLDLMREALEEKTGRKAWSDEFAKRLLKTVEDRGIAEERMQEEI